MIQAAHNNAYPSPLSPQMLKDYHKVLMQRLAATAELARANEEKVQRTLDPEITKVFKAGSAKTLVDLFA